MTPIATTPAAREADDRRDRLGGVVLSVGLSARDREQLARLAAFRSWRLHRISPSTYHKDLSPPPPRALRDGRPLYRCRIGAGAWRYGRSVAEAITEALAAHRDGGSCE